MDIDIVIPWVDGSDILWQEEKRKYSSDVISDANNINRFRDWNLMRYWFRSIEKYIPWVHMIHFVTWGHLPEFLNTEHPKLHIVRHEEYIPERWLPTFSSHAIEMNIHRIPGLADHFIYFNDDTFICKPMKKEDFFKQGLPCIQFTEIPLGFVGHLEAWQFAAANDLGVINKWFSKNAAERKHPGKYINYKYSWYDNLRSILLLMLFPNFFSGFKNYHSPVPYRKEVFQELWEKEPALLEKTCSHRFRNKEDVNQWVAHWWQLASGKFTPKRLDAPTYGITSKTIETICKDIREQRHEMISINDSANEAEFDLLQKQLEEAFKMLLPEKSSFEC